MPLANFIDDADLKSSVKAALGVDDASNLPSFWDAIISGANASATSDIYERLCAVGFSADHVSQWDQAPSFARDQGTFWALTRGAGLGNYQGPKEHLDRREELSTKTVLIIDGVPTAVAVGESQVGGISYGRNDAAAAAKRQFQILSGNACGCRRY